MRTTRNIIVGFALVWGAFSSSADEARAGERLDEFSEFTYRQGRLGGWRLDEAVEARITAEDVGGYRLELTVIALGDGSIPEPGCLDAPLYPPVENACPKPVELAPRSLTEDEARRVVLAFRDIVLERELDPDCEAVGAPLRLASFRWDDTEATDFFCYPPYVPWENAREIERLLDRLRDGSRDCDGNGVIDAFDIQGGAPDEDDNGVPDECQPSFVRGDSNGSGAVDISDAINTFQYLFLGDSRIGCLDAADSNDDGAVDISDPIGTLAFLFTDTGGTGLPSCGIDTTEDDLGCDSTPGCP